MNGAAYYPVPTQDPGGFPGGGVPANPSEYPNNYPQAYPNDYPQAYPGAPLAYADGQDPNARPPPQQVMEMDTWNAEVAAGKAMTVLSKTARGTCNIEGGSVYGVALAMPQFARTAGYSLKYTGLVVRAYFFLFCNMSLQGFLLYMISKEERIMSKYGGQMHLCDFGANIGNCPDGPNCVGPGGTPYTPERLYNFEMWSTRSYVRDSLNALFPDMADAIGDKVDPGEYGLESYSLRMICCLLFVIGCWGDLQSTMSMWTLLRQVPNAAEPWISYEVPKWDTKERCKAMFGWTELNLVKFKVAGMPIKWKIINYLFVWFPKLWIWLVTLDSGVVFLLETAVIEDMIINAVALAFILAIDELICTALVSPVSLYMATNCQAFELCNLTDEEDDTEKDAYDKHQADKNWHICTCQLLGYIIPVRLFQIAGVTGFFIAKYYAEHCKRADDGRGWVSTDVRLPLSEKLNFLTFLLGPIPWSEPVATVDDSVWSMP